MTPKTLTIRQGDVALVKVDTLRAVLIGVTSPVWVPALALFLAIGVAIILPLDEWWGRVCRGYAERERDKEKAAAIRKHLGERG